MKRRFCLWFFERQYQLAFRRQDQALMVWWQRRIEALL